MNLLIRLCKTEFIGVGKELPEVSIIGDVYLNQRKLLKAQETVDGTSVIIQGESYFIGRREYPLCGQYGIKAVATSDGIVPLLRIAKSKERTISQKITRDRFGQVDISGPENECWPILERIISLSPVVSEIVEEFVEVISEEEVSCKEEDEEE